MRHLKLETHDASFWLTQRIPKVVKERFLLAAAAAWGIL
jgi:hypothetical protein